MYKYNYVIVLCALWIIFVTIAIALSLFESFSAFSVTSCCNVALGGGLPVLVEMACVRKWQVLHLYNFQSLGITDDLSRAGTSFIGWYSLVVLSKSLKTFCRVVYPHIILSALKLCSFFISSRKLEQPMFGQSAGSSTKQEHGLGFWYLEESNGSRTVNVHAPHIHWYLCTILSFALFTMA